MAGMLASQGVRTIQTFGLPDSDTLAQFEGAEAVVISLKTRSIPAADAVQQSLTALRSLDAWQIQFKYCSTFDSTSQGNIGPVASALMQDLNTEFSIAVPALPVNGRTQYLGYLFVNGVPLAESHMRHHPLNPMTDSNLVRHLQAQTSLPVSLIDIRTVRGARMTPRPGIALVDAIEDSDLARVAHAFVDLPLLTGGSGISGALPEAWRDFHGWSPSPSTLPDGGGHSTKALLLAGSCSAATLKQIEAWRAVGHPLVRLRTGEEENLLDWVEQTWRSEPAVLIYSSAPPEERTGSAADIESAFAHIARKLSGRYQRLIVAGGETSGAVVEALGIRAVRIGEVIDPGVPALQVAAGPRLSMALKSGNFGSPEFFEKALHALE